MTDTETSFETGFDDRASAVDLAIDHHPTRTRPILAERDGRDPAIGLSPTAAGLPAGADHSAPGAIPRERA